MIGCGVYVTRRAIFTVTLSKNRSVVQMSQHGLTSSATLTLHSRLGCAGVLDQVACVCEPHGWIHGVCVGGGVWLCLLKVFDTAAASRSWPRILSPRAFSQSQDHRWQAATPTSLQFAQSSGSFHLTIQCAQKHDHILR